ncbi:unnamed protein product [Porites lobata]|uniref:Uncharacterized protein n=1 Tax=Porites lobata TaxID=104759 RepID=A0ABN8REQ7_9CNID|nr:unnamed protein product [Porites lobata]
MTSTSKNKEMKDKRADSIEAVQEANEQPSLPSIYSIAAAHSLSKDLKQKSLHLIKVKRRHGDYGQFDLTHAWSPEDLMDDLGSRYESGRSRDSTLADESLTLARPFVMEPLRTFQEHKVKPIIQHVLETNLAEQKYDPVFCRDAAVTMAEVIKERVKKLCYPRYKFVCHVVVGEVNQQDVKVVSRCAWDSAVDRFVQYQYSNYYLYAVGIVYAVYCE